MKAQKLQSKYEEGMMSVEAVLALVPFLLVILGIISLINIYMVHNRIQYAMFEAGSQLSAYTYLYQALGLRDADQALGEDTDTNTKKVDTLLEAYDSFQDETSVETGKTLVEDAVDFISDPKEAAANVLYLLIEKGEENLKDALIELLGGSLMKVYLDQSYDPYYAMDTDTYLKKYGVVDGFSGLSFDNSNFLSDDNYSIIDIVVEYDLEIYFFKLFLKDPTVHVVQRCTIPAWLDGDGEEYNISK